MSDCKHPIAYPVAVPVVWLVTELILVFVHMDDLLAGDWFARLGFASGIVLLALVAFDLFERWRRRQR